jgi:hypothetical protein
MLVDPTDPDLEYPVQINPGRSPPSECIEIDSRDLTALANEVSSAEVPVVVGIFERKHTEKKSQSEEKSQKGTVREPKPQGQSIR